MEQAEAAYSEQELSLLLMLKEYQSASLPLFHGRKTKHSVTAPEHAFDHSPTWGGCQVRERLWLSLHTRYCPVETGHVY